MSGLSRNLFNTIGIFYRYTRNTKRPYQMVRLLSSKEVGYGKNTLNQDILLYNLKSASTTHNLLEIISAHHKIMNSKHLMQAFRTLFSLQKTENSDRMDITSHPTFKSLCWSLKTNVRSIEINELIEALKILSFVGVQSNTTIVQIILQMIRHNVNALNLQQIIFLDFLLKQFKPTPLSEALLIAFPIVFEIQLPMKMEHNNLSQLTDLLQYATKNKLPDSTVSLLLEAITANKEVNPKAALSIVWSICDFKPNESYAPVLRKCLKTIVKFGDNLKISDLETVLTKLSYRYNKNQEYYFNKEFFNLVADHVVTNDLGFQQCIWILRKFAKVGYSNNAILDYISTLCHNDRNLVSKADLWNIFTLVTGFATTDYRPIYWESIKQGILDNENLLLENRKIEWIKFATRLAILDIFIADVLEKSLQENYISRLINNGIFACVENFLVLYQTVSTLRPEYCNLLPDISYVQKATNHVYSAEIEEKFRPLQPALERGFGGEAYVLSNVVTKLGHLLHHVVIMRKGGFPVAFKISEQKKTLILEELQVPADSHVIAVFGYDASYYKLDSNVLRSIYSLTLRTIEACGYSVIPVSLDMWSGLSDHEKIPFLMQNIRVKNEEFERLSAVHNTTMSCLLEIDEVNVLLQIFPPLYVRYLNGNCFCCCCSRDLLDRLLTLDNMG